MNSDQLSVDEMILKKDLYTTKKYEYYKLFEEYKKKIHALENLIHKNCNHVWKYDNTYCGPYDKREQICEKCKLYYNKYYYT